jgi:hypothetical protein
MTNDLVAFLKAHLDEDADLARRCDGAEFSAGGGAVRGCGPEVACVGCFHPDHHRPRQSRADEALESRSSVQWRAPPGRQEPRPLHGAWVEGGREGSGASGELRNEGQARFSLHCRLDTGSLCLH